MTLTWSRRHTLIAGVALIALTNAVALGGVAWNRSGEPGSVLKLTQREMWEPYRFAFERDGGGFQLSIRWRALGAEPNVAYYVDNFGPPEWLNEAKLAELGFNVAPPPETRRANRHERQLPREALVVLELDGPAYQKALERARERAAREAGKAEETGKKGPGTPAEQAALFLRNEETANSRLFAVDAGRDAQALRAKYPDRTRYAIVQGKIRPSYLYGRGNEARWTGYIDGIQNTQVNVPLELREALESAQRSKLPAPARGGELAFEVTVAFGKRFEPWIIAVSAAAK